jgi:hypothetical protein
MLQCPYCNQEIPLQLFTSYIGKMARGKTSEAKKLSSRLNGKKGGRPRKQKGKR